MRKIILKFSSLLTISVPGYPCFCRSGHRLHNDVFEALRLWQPRIQFAPVSVRNAMVAARKGMDRMECWQRSIHHHHKRVLFLIFVKNDFDRLIKFIFSCDRLIVADFTTLAILISFGAVLGKTTSAQLVTMAIFGVLAQVVNEYINVYVFQVGLFCELFVTLTLIQKIFFPSFSRLMTSVKACTSIYLVPCLASAFPKR
jgi:hypothetical protein